MTRSNTDRGFDSDGSLASQQMDRATTRFSDVPERRLLLALLVNAIHSLQIGGKPRAEVFAWVRGQNAAVRMSFRFVCDGLGMEVAPLARRLLKSATAGIQLPLRHLHVRSHGARGTSRSVVTDD